MKKIPGLEFIDKKVKGKNIITTVSLTGASRFKTTNSPEGFKCMAIEKTSARGGSVKLTFQSQKRGAKANVLELTAEDFERVCFLFAPMPE